MSAPHTPGPWTLDRVSCGQGAVEYQIGFADGSGFPLGGCVEADARLIAAAPDLLEIAEAILRTALIHKDRADACLVDREHLGKLQTAVKKARAVS